MNNYFNEKAVLSIDPKGRFLLPKDVRSEFKIKKGDVLFLLPDFSALPYLEIRTRAQWELYCRRLREDEGSEEKKNTFRYAMLAKETATVDGGGRILVPHRIKKACGLDGTVAVINMAIYIEVWASDHMEKKYPDLVKAFKKTNDRTF
ncbi:MAG: hypothetical protein ACE5EO_02870 [Candidatus Krumholzibacteriia bacterium]